MKVGSDGRLRTYMLVFGRHDLGVLISNVKAKARVLDELRYMYAEDVDTLGIDHLDTPYDQFAVKMRLD